MFGVNAAACAHRRVYRRPQRALAVITLALGACITTVGCTIDKEPLHAGWLAPGVYPYPAPYRCTPPTPPGQPYGTLLQWQLPAIDLRGGLSASLPWVGSFTASAHGAGTVGARSFVSSRATQPVRIAEDRVVPAQIPGFVAGVDLRAYHRIAFIADTSGWICEYAKCPGSDVGTSNLPAPLLKIMGDQIDAAVAGLRADQFFVVSAGSAWREATFTPISAAGRQLAGDFVRGQVCSGAHGVRGQLLRVLPYAPEIVVLFTDGGPQMHRYNDYERRYESCELQPSYLYCYVDDTTEELTLNKFADGQRLPPVIAVTVKRHDARWLKNLAEATGGAYVDVAP
jgi:hypothetical protein